VISPTQRTLPTQHHKHNRRTSTPSVVFEPAIPATKQTQKYAFPHKTHYFFGCYCPSISCFRNLFYLTLAGRSILRHALLTPRYELHSVTV